jgi:hypothetical protein
MDITSNTFCKFTATFRTQICRKCLRIKLNGFRPIWTLTDIASNTFCKCTATFRTNCTCCFLLHVTGYKSKKVSEQRYFQLHDQICQVTRQYFIEENNPHSHCHHNRRSYLLLFCCKLLFFISLF